MFNQNRIGHISNRLFNEEIYKLYEIFKHINHYDTKEPNVSIDGQIWNDNGILKYSKNGVWTVFSNDTIKLVSEIMSTVQPSNPVYGQLWIDDGILKYYNGHIFVAIKSNLIAHNDTSLIPNYIMLDSVMPLGESFSTSHGNAVQYNIKITISDGDNVWSKDDTTSLYYYLIPKTAHGIGPVFTHSISHIISSSDGIMLTQLDNEEYQLVSKTNGDIIFYIKTPIDCIVSIAGIDDAYEKNVGNYTQYPVVDANNDKVFINNVLSDNYSAINDITISVPSDIDSESITNIHMSNNNVSKITKHLVAVNTSNPTIEIPVKSGDSYAEYYIFDNIFTLLRSSDFTDEGNHIKINNDYINEINSQNNEYILALVVVYSFIDSYNNGNMDKLSGIVPSSISKDEIDSFVEKYDSYMVYIDGSPLTSSGIELYNHNYNNQIVADNNEVIKIYNNNNYIELPSNISDILNIIGTFNIEDNTNKRYDIYAYNYARAIEHEMSSGVATISILDDGSVLYNINSNHTYKPNTNALSIYINGIRQYPGTFVENSPTSFSFKDSSKQFENVTYVIEPIEYSEKFSFEYKILFNKMYGFVNSYDTEDLYLTGGYIKVYQNGVRLNTSEYKIQSPTVLTILGDSHDDDIILVEVRHDYTLREITLPIKSYNQTEWTVGATISEYNSVPYDGVPITLIKTPDIINIYINGIKFGTSSNYQIIDKTIKSIKLDDDIKNLLDKDAIDNGYVTFEWRY